MTDEIKPVDTPSVWSDPDHRFTGLPLRLEFVDGIRWRVTRKVSYLTESKETSTVKTGFITDFASVPRIFFWALPPSGTEANPYGIAALFHDWCYAHKTIGGRAIERWEADNLFYEIMRYIGTDWFVAHIMWSQVRMWGWTVW